MRHFAPLCLILLAFAGINLLQAHDVTSQADFWVGVGAAICGGAMAYAFILIAKD